MHQIPRRIQAVLFVFAASLCSLSAVRAEVRVYPEGEVPKDKRLDPLKDLNAYFPFEVPNDRAAWEKRKEELRRRVLVATGLWPMPEKTPLNAKIFGKFQRDGFTVEKVYFESLPGHFVTGLLFRPEGAGNNLPAVLCPHGHGGRLQDYGEKAMPRLIQEGWERYEKSGRFPKLARCAGLARLGCVAFIFDMEGYADSQQLSKELIHRFGKQRDGFDTKTSWGFYGPQAESRLQSVMGLQTWNSIRALDFLTSLEDVDPNRVAVTGGSGGGTQTILLGAIDDRPIAAFPQGMVSTSMQGGCTCENCSLLRIGTGNVELAALFAPKPQAMTAADDWTKEMMTKGYPELRKLYSLYGVEEKVACYPQLHFKHNYNSATRELMYAWLNKHLKLGHKEPIVERDFEPLTPEEYTIWDKENPAPAGGDEHEKSVTKFFTEQAEKQLAKVAPRDEQSLAEYRRVVGGAWETLIGRKLPKPLEITRTKIDKQKKAGYLHFEDTLHLDPAGEEFPIVSFYPTSTEWNGKVVIWIDGAGKSALFTKNDELKADVRRLLDAGVSVVGADLFMQGEFLSGADAIDQQHVVKNPREFAGYTFGYNHPLFVKRVHDVLTLIAFVKGDEHEPKEVNLIGTGGAGPIAAAARAIVGSAVDKAAVDTAGFRFENLTSYRDVDFVPGAVKYGDLPGLLSLSAPNPLWISGEKSLPAIVRQTYEAAGKAKNVQTADDRQDTLNAAVEWLLK